MAKMNIEKNRDSGFIKQSYREEHMEEQKKYL